MSAFNSNIPYRPFRPKTKFWNLTGQQFGQLLVLALYGKNRNGSALWLCQCSCRNVTIHDSPSLRRRNAISCGCRRQETMEAFAVMSVTHGLSKTPEYRPYCSAKGRCNNPKDTSYAGYGGRGIEFRFTSFEQFLADIGPKPSKKHSLNRIDNEGHYEPGNVEWATPQEQARNRRSSRYITYNGETKVLAEWAEILHIPHNALHEQLGKRPFAEIVASLE